MVKFYLLNLTLYNNKKKDGHSSIQTMVVSFSFITLTRVITSRLHRKGTSTKDISIKFLQISLIPQEILRKKKKKNPYKNFKN